MDESIVAECLRRLSAEGLGSVFWYDVEHQQFVPSSMDGEKPLGELWFYITDEGLAAVDENWDDKWLEGRPVRRLRSLGKAGVPDALRPVHT